MELELRSPLVIVWCRPDSRPGTERNCPAAGWCVSWSASAAYPGRTRGTALSSNCANWKLLYNATGKVGNVFNNLTIQLFRRNLVSFDITPAMIETNSAEVETALSGDDSVTCPFRRSGLESMLPSNGNSGLNRGSLILNQKSFQSSDENQKYLLYLLLPVICWRFPAPRFPTNAATDEPDPQFFRKTIRMINGMKFPLHCQWRQRTCIQVSPLMKY